jgi:protein-S-isoprenylcysteine O-methyltransferase Ste14
MTAVDIAVGVIWAAFWIYWLAASTRVKSGQSQWARFAGFRLVLVVVIVFVLRVPGLRGATATHDPWWLKGVGLALFALGLGLAVWARIYLGRNWGMPMSRKNEPELVTTGPYHRVRHPIYSGIILATIGTGLAVNLSWLVASVVFGAYFIYSATSEERYMAGEFPDTYPGYKRSTKMLIPFVF